MLQDRKDCDAPIIHTADELKKRCRNSPHIFLSGVLLSLNWGLSGAFLVVSAYIASPGDIDVGNFTTCSQEFPGTETSANLISSSFSLGNLIFAPLFGIVSDRWGRRPLVIVSVLATGLTGILCAMAPSFDKLLISRFLQGVFYSPTTLINWVLVAESTPKEIHGAWGSVFGLSWVIGSALVAPAVIISSSWRNLLVILSLPNILLAIVLYLYLQESLDYCLQKDHYTKIECFIERNLKKDGYVVDVEALTRDKKNSFVDKKEKLPYWERILNNQNFLYVLLTSCYMSFAYTLVHNAMSLTSTVIQFGNIHTNFVLSSLVELPSYAVVPFLYHFVGDRGTVCVFHILTSISGVAIYFITPDHWMYLVVWMLAKFASSSAFMCVLAFISCKCPVEYRNSCVALSASFGNLAAVFAPQVYLLEGMIQGGMFLLFAATTLLAVVLTLLVPDKV